MQVKTSMNIWGAGDASTMHWGLPYKTHLPYKTLFYHTMTLVCTTTTVKHNMVANMTWNIIITMGTSLCGGRVVPPRVHGRGIGKCTGSVWEVGWKCVESVWEVPGKCAGNVGGSSFGSGWQYGIDPKQL